MPNAAAQVSADLPSSSPMLSNSYPYTLPDVARFLNVSESSVRRWIKSGELPAIRVGPGGRYRITRAAVVAQMAVVER